MLDFHTGAVIFQLVSLIGLIIPLAIIGLIVYGIVMFTKQFNVLKSLEKQNEEILKKLSEVKQSQAD
jgi:hypothetical protein